MNELALFAGAGGGILGGKLLGWRTVCAVEWEQYPASVLCARQNDGILPPFPIWDDIQTFDGKPWRGIVDVVSGGFPCQDISAAGKGDGLDGERSGMWNHMARVVSEVRPQFVFVENSPMLTTRGGTRVIGDLTSMGYDTRWTVMGAADIGANHQRDRIWILGKLVNSNNNGSFASKVGKGIDERGDNRSTKSIKANKSERSSKQYAELADTKNSWHVWWDRFMGTTEQEYNKRRSQIDGCWEWWKAEPDVGRVADGVAARVDRLKAIGNGQVPLCAATAWRILSESR
jgi:DNA (cytosine-5)-methyltransferase 1